MAYIYNADIYCDDCGREIKERIKAECPNDWRAMKADGDSDSWPQGPYPDGGGEADCPQHCGDCGEFLENPLTAYGLQYVKQAIADYENGFPGTAEVIEQWRSYYDIAADEPEECEADEA